MTNKLKTYLLAFLLVQVILSYANLAFAQTSSSPNYTQYHVSDQIKQYLCAPTENNQGKYWSQNGSFFGTGSDSQVGANNAAQNDLYTCINRLYRFSIILASIIGVFFIVIAGYIYMSADGSQESVDKAKNILVSTVTSLIILFIGFIFLRAINPDLVKFQNIQPQSVRLELMEAPTANLYQGVARDQAGVNSVNGSCSNVSSMTAANLCQAANVTCWNSNCNNYGTAIKDAAAAISIPGINTEALIKSIMVNESSCNINSTSNAGSCGLMQLLPQTANNLKSSCGVTDNITCAWLNNPNNATKSICIGAKYLELLSRNGCGNDVRNIAAGYNGGSMACQNSVTCAGQNDCAGQPTKKWECLYNGPQGSTATCNTGYNETRNYAPKILGCYKQNGGN